MYLDLYPLNHRSEEEKETKKYLPPPPPNKTHLQMRTSREEAAIIQWTNQPTPQPVIREIQTFCLSSLLSDSC